MGKIDMNSQEWLKLKYYLQENRSNAVITPQITIKSIDDRRVYISYDYTINQWVYSVVPIDNKLSQNTDLSVLGQFKGSRGRGGRPPKGSVKDWARQLLKQGYSVRKAAELINQVRKTAGMIKIMEPISKSAIHRIKQEMERKKAVGRETGKS